MNGCGAVIAIGGLMISLVLVYYIYHGSDNRGSQSSAPATVPAEKPIKISAEALSAAYENNEVRADNKYKDKLLKVSGTIETISKGTFGGINIRLSDGQPYSLGGVSIDLSDSYSKSVGNLNKGDRLSVVARCHGKTLTFVFLEAE